MNLIEKIMGLIEITEITPSYQKQMPNLNLPSFTLATFLSDIKNSS